MVLGWLRNVYKVWCTYKVHYTLLILSVLCLSCLMFYYDISYKLLPNVLSRDFSTTAEYGVQYFRSQDEQYIEFFNKIISNNKTKKKILVWTKFFRSYYWVNEIRAKLKTCKSSCEVTYDREQLNEADALLFHHGDVKISDLPSSRYQNKPWVLFTLEPTSLISGNVNLWGQIFNWTMSYRTYSTVFNPYGYYINKTKLTSELNIGYQDRLKDMFAVISRCHDDGKRYKIIHELSKYFQIDVFGACSTNNLTCKIKGFYCIPPEDSRRYKFRLAFENSNCRDYITEKYWNTLTQNVVPIVNWKKYQRNDHPLESALNSTRRMNVLPESYINIFDFQNMTEAIRFINAVSENETLYRSFYSWKKQHTPVVSIYSGFCRLCDKLNKPFQAQVYKNLEKWFSDDTCNKNSIFSGVWRHIDRFIFDKIHGYKRQK